MTITLDDNEIHTLLKALYQAEYEFDTNHNLIVTDLEQENDTSWCLDYSNVLKLIADATPILEKSGYNYIPD